MILHHLGVLLGSLLSFLLVMIPIIWIHELAHFLVGKWMGAKPDVFSIGFGKKLFSFRFMDADWQIALIPLGGFVRFQKQQFQYERDLLTPDDKEPLAAWRWIPIVLAGPVANIMLAALIGLGLIYHELRLVSVVSIKDKGTAFVVQKPKESYFLLKVCDQHCPYAILYNNGKFKALVRSEFDDLGVSKQLRDFSLSEKLFYSGAITGQALKATTALTGEGLSRSVTTTSGYKELSGPIGIASISNQAREEGLAAFLAILAVISLSVGLFNLVPLGILDGGRAMLGMYEVITRRGVSSKFMIPFQFVSFGALILLLLAGLVGDLSRTFGF